MQMVKNGGLADTPNSLGSENVDSEMTLPLSAVVLEHLKVDLRKWLGALSLEIVEGLGVYF